MAGGWVPRAWLAALLWLAVAGNCVAQVEFDDLPRDPLEIEALSDPDGVLAKLPAELEKARSQGDQRQLSLLYLAKANACRVTADWVCQRDAGNGAKQAAAEAHEPILQVRGLIAESRGQIALQDFSRGERLLGQAELLLSRTPSPVLLSDVFLAYSSLSALLGKHQLAADYAQRGLGQISGDVALPMQTRLLRNLASAQSQMGQFDEARQSLARAQSLAEHFDDPKLSADLSQEVARLAHLNHDIPAQQESGRHILALAKSLQNSQLYGLGHEVMGVAALDANRPLVAERELATATASFRKLGLGRDELRTLRKLLHLRVGRRAPTAEIMPLMTRLLALDESIEEAERAKASEDFDARLKYAAGEVELVRLKDQAILAREREQAFKKSNQLTQAVMGLGAVVVLVLAVSYLLQKRLTRRLREALARGQESEARYRILADNSRDLVVRMRPDGRRVYVSPSSREMLGLEPSELLDVRWDLVHPDDIDSVRATLGALVRDGGTATITYRARHADGHWVAIEVLARLVTSADGVEIVYSGRDVTARLEAEKALDATRNQLRAVTDNIPALIAYIDTDQRYRFVNAYVDRILGLDPADVLGRTVREVRGDDDYQSIRKHVEAALAGSRVNFEGERDLNGRRFHYQANYVPDVDGNGRVRGFYALTFDISRLKDAEQELARQARYDSLTGIANRRHFEDRLASTLAHSRRHHSPVTLLYVDIDHFKQINDRGGHALGDAVLREFALRLQAAVREEDLVARLGGDEFVVLVDDATAASTGEVIARNLLEAMRQPIHAEGQAVDATVSIGIAYCPEAISAEVLMAAADEALYAAKAGGRNRYRLIVRA